MTPDAISHHTLRAAWEDYRRCMLQDDTPEDLADFVRVTFYSGAMVAAEMIVASAATDDPELLDTVRRELNAFLKEVSERADAVRREGGR